MHKLLVFNNHIHTSSAWLSSSPYNKFQLKHGLSDCFPNDRSWLTFAVYWISSRFKVHCSLLFNINVKMFLNWLSENFNACMNRGWVTHCSVGIGIKSILHFHLNTVILFKRDTKWGSRSDLLEIEISHVKRYVM